MGYLVGNVLDHIRSGDVVMDDHVVFASACRIVYVAKDVRVLGIVSVCHTRVHIPRYIFVSRYTMHPIDFFILQYIKRYTVAKIFEIPLIGQKKTETDILKGFISNLRAYLKDHDVMLFTVPGESYR